MKIYNQTQKNHHNYSMKKLIPQTTIALIFLCLTNISSHAAVLLAWETEGIPSPTEVKFDATTVDPHMKSSALTRGSGLGTGGSAGSNPNFFYAAGFSSGSTYSSAVAANSYFAFSVQASSGNVISVSSINLNFRRPTTGPSSIQFAYSIDNGVNFTAINLPITTVSNTNGSAYSVDLSAIAPLQGVSSQILFRLYGWNASGSAVGQIGNLPGNDLVINGTFSTVPEPNTSALITSSILALGLVIGTHRWRMKIGN